MLKISVEFLGQQISRGGMTPTEAKLKAVQDWATPEDVKGVRSFLGFANYYRRFVQNFAAIADPIDIIDEEGRGVAMGALSIACLSAFKRSFVRCASFTVP